MRDNEVPTQHGTLHSPVLHVKAFGGAEIRHVIEDMCEISIKSDVAVTTEFNGRTVYIDFRDIVASVVEEWQGTVPLA